MSSTTSALPSGCGSIHRVGLSKSTQRLATESPVRSDVVGGPRARWKVQAGVDSRLRDAQNPREPTWGRGSMVRWNGIPERSGAGMLAVRPPNSQSE